MYQSSSGFTLEAQITCADFRFAKLGRKIKMANHSEEKQCGARRLNGLFRSLKKHAEPFFTIPVLLTATSGHLDSTTSPRILVSGFALIFRSARCASITGIQYSAMDITVAVVSTST